jgi:hypothetical protein
MSKTPAILCVIHHRQNPIDNYTHVHLSVIRISGMDNLSLNQKQRTHVKYMLKTMCFIVGNIYGLTCFREILSLGRTTG